MMTVICVNKSWKQYMHIQSYKKNNLKHLYLSWCFGRFTGWIFADVIFLLSYLHFRKAFACLLRIALLYNTSGFVFPKYTPFLSNQQKTLIRSSVLVISVLFFVVADLKRICETENGSLEIKNDKVRQILGKNGLATQCIQAKNAMSCKDMTLAQLCLKINSKMGGANNAIAPHSVTRLVSLPF